MAKTVLYVHGLESGPTGRKVRLLEEAGFTVVSVQMPCGRPQIVRDPAVWATAAAAVGLVTGGAALGGAPGALVAGGVALALAPWVKSRLTRRVFRRSVLVQRDVLKHSKIDVVVGSSFGGAVTLELQASGDWAGPTLLLCPAHRLVARRSRRAPTLDRLTDALAARTAVVHGRADTTVPVADSQALVEGTEARLVLVDDDHRLTTTATPERFREWIALVSP